MSQDVGKDQQAWTGRSDSIIPAQLTADFWTIGKEVTGKIDGWREVTFTDPETKLKRGGTAYRLALQTPIQVNGEEEKLVEITALSGIVNALKDLKIKGYNEIKKGDVWSVECTGMRKSKREGFQDSPEFEIQVIRK